MWSSSRQSFVTMSTAEAELLGYSEGHQVAESTKALLSILELPMGRTVLYGDNRAAISLATAETGPWRTRHLRLRASKLREILREAGASWAMQHLEGSELVADGLTKALLGGAFLKYQRKLGLESEAMPKVQKAVAIDKPTADLDHLGAEYRVKLQKVVPWLLAAGGAIATMCPEVGILIVLAAWIVKRWEGSKREQEGIKIREDSKRKGGGAPSAQDDSPTRGEVTVLSAQDGREATPLGLGAPGLKALRARDLGSHDHSAQRPVTPGVRQRGSTSSASSSAGVAAGEQGAGAEGRGRGYGSGAAERAAAAGYPSHRPGVHPELDRVVPEVDVNEEPWHDARFQSPGRGQDRWSMELWNQGWVLRLHPKGRKQLFVPVHSTMPVSGQQLTGERVTLLKFADTGNQEVTCDRWDEPRPRRFEGTWTGITFLKRKMTYAFEDGDGDGDFEVVPR